MDTNTIETYLSNRDLSKNTMQFYARTYNDLAEWLQANDLEAESFDGPAFDRFCADHPTWHKNTRVTVLASIKAFCRRVFGDDHPLLAKELHREAVGALRTPDRKEVRAMLDAIPGDALGVRDEAVIRILFATGLRASELAGLQLEHVDLEGGRLLIFQSKTNSWKTPLVDRATAKAIRAWLKIREAYADPDETALFVGIGGNKPGRAMTRWGVRSVTQRASERARIKTAPPHSFRRAMATDDARRNVPMTATMTQGGWKTPAMVAHYQAAFRAEDYRVYLAEL